MIGRLDDDLVRANAVHPVEHAFGLAIQIAFDTQRRKLVRNDPNGPPGSVAQWRRAAVGIGTVCLDFRGCLALIARAEGAEPASDSHAFAHKICRDAWRGRSK